MTTGILLRELRHKRRLTQTELARVAGVAQSTIALIEADKRGYSVRSLKAISQALRISPAKLIADD